MKKKMKKFETERMTPGEFFDRFTILLQKAFYSDNYKKRVDEYVNILNKNGLDGEILKTVCMLQILHVKIWYLESDIRRGRECELGLLEVGRRAIEIRNFNRERIELSNKLNILLGESIQEEKFDHCSIKRKNVDNLHSTPTI